MEKGDTEGTFPTQFLNPVLKEEGIALAEKELERFEKSIAKKAGFFGVGFKW